MEKGEDPHGLLSLAPIGEKNEVFVEESLGDSVWKKYRVMKSLKIVEESQWKFWMGNQSIEVESRLSHHKVRWNTLNEVLSLIEMGKIPSRNTTAHPSYPNQASSSTPATHLSL
ncbi:hypothetical protein Tco_0201052 [Tanacetum coccineum]